MAKTFNELMREARAQVRELWPDEARQLAGEGAYLIDIREQHEWEEGHIPGAIHVPRSYLEMEIESAAPLRDRPIILYCAAGVRSLLSGAQLRAMGYARPDLDGGRLRAVEDRGAAVDRPGRPHRGAETPVQPASPDPGGGFRGPGAAPRLARPVRSAPAGSAPRPSSTSPPRVSAPSGSSTSTWWTPPTSSARSSTPRSGSGSRRPSRPP